MSKISVIIPVYNVEKYLDECLMSVVNQTLEGIEIICVDDGSTDDSLNILNKYAKKYDSIKIIQKENGGQSSARNVALNIAKGEYIYFLDSDDYIEKDTLYDLYQYVKTEDLDIVYFDTTLLFENESVKMCNKEYVDYYERKKNYKEICTGQRMFAVMQKNHEFFGQPCLQIFRKSLIEKNNIRFYEGIIHEDNLFTFQCTMLAQRVGYIAKKYYNRRMHDDSTMTKKKSMRNVEGYIVSYSEMLTFLHNKKIEKEAIPQIKEFLDNIYLNAYNIFKSLEVDDKDALLTNGDFCAKYLFELLKQKNQEEKKIRKKLDILEQNIFYRIRKKAKSVINRLRTIKNKKYGHIKNFVERPEIKYPVSFLKESVLKKKEKGIPFVSVIMPVYNVEQYIGQALDSLLNQSECNFEIIAIDDGSTDKSLEILNEYAIADKRLRIFQQENKYAGAARNVGIENAKGEYLLFLDSDDFFEKNLIKEAYYTAKIKNADIIIFGARCYNDKNGKYIDGDWLFNSSLVPKKQPFNHNDCSERFYDITSPCPWTKMFRRQFILDADLKFQKIQNTNDLFFVYSALALAKRIVTIDKKLVNYRIGLQNNLQTVKAKDPLCFYEALKLWHDQLKCSGCLEELRSSYVNVALDGCLFNLHSINDLDAKEQVFYILKNEGFERLELVGYEDSFYNSGKNYQEMLLVRKTNFEQYLENE